MAPVREVDLVVTLTSGFTAALVLGLAARRLRLSPLVGYLLAGVVVGPFTPGFVAHGAITGQLAEIGVVLLMFGVGLHFRLGELVRARERTVVGAVLGMIATGVAGAGLGYAMGWSLRACAAFGIALSPASTVVLLRSLDDAGKLESKDGQVAVRWMVVEDLLVVLLLVLLPIGARGNLASMAAAAATAKAIAKVVGLVALVVLLGRGVVPRILAWVDRRGSRELFTLAVLVIALGGALAASEWFGVSMALGAFMGGTIVGQSPLAARAGAEAIPLRDAFAVLFFVSVGMRLDPAQVVSNLGLTLAVLAVVFSMKPLVAWAVTRRASASRARLLAASVGQVGEFSFIVAAEAIADGLLPARALQALVGAAMLSIAVQPFAVRRAAREGPRRGAKPRVTPRTRVIVKNGSLRSPTATSSQPRTS